MSARKSRIENEADIRFDNENNIKPSEIIKPSSDVYQCELCGKSFKSLKSLKAHQLRSHRIALRERLPLSL